jgi:voltage-gated potassium channel
MDSKKSIILFGFGSFGRHLYKNLVKSGHSVRVISGLDEHIDFGKNLGVDIQKIDIRRDTEIKSLNIDSSKDILYCAMSKTAENVFLVMSLRTLYPNSKIVSISNSFENTRKLKYVGVDNVIDLYEATARRVVNTLTKPAVTRAIDEIIYHQNDLKMAEIKLSKDSFVDGKKISEVPFKKFGIILVAIIDKELGNELIFTDNRIDNKLDTGDILVVVGETKDIENFRKILKADNLLI